LSELIEKLGTIVLRDLELDSGKVLPVVGQAYAMYGEPSPDGSNVVLICHALTGSHHLAGPDVPGLPGAWLGPVLGPGKAIDTNRLCAICFNNLCSPYGSESPASVNPDTGRPWGMTFPVVTPRDVARAQKRALEAMGIPRLAMVLGGSFGGMISLECAMSFPDDVARCGVIAAPARLYPQAIAYNEVQRQAITSDPDWKGGDYYPGPGPAKGLATARMLAMITYRSEQNFAGRWMRGMAGESPAHEWGSKFKVETYLEHHGNELVSRFDANCYLYATRAMDLHDVTAGRGGLDDAFARLRGKSVLAVGISSDILFPNWQVMEAARHAGKAGARSAYEEIESDNGHDAFLIDFDQLDEILRFFFRQENM
jgi:homoserine O-acetyltransferase